jgi:hypothetical protein
MRNFTEELRARARRYRQAAETGPRRERAYQLTYAYCLEQGANALERDAQQLPLPGIAGEQRRDEFVGSSVSF